MTLSLVRGVDTDAILLYGPPGVTKSVQMQLGFERSVFIGRSIDMMSGARAIGAHPSVPLHSLFTDPNTGKPYKEPAVWDLDSVLNFGHMLLYNYQNNDQAREYFDQFDAVILDDLSLIHASVKSMKEREVARVGASHQLAASSGAVNAGALYSYITDTSTEMLRLMGKLPMSFGTTAHDRPAEDHNKYGYLPGAPHMATRPFSQKIVSIYSSAYHLDRNPDWMDPWATEDSPIGCSFFARYMDQNWASRCRRNVVQGHGPADLWSVLELAGIRHRRAKGREFLDDWVLTAANDALSICGTGSSFNAASDARMALARKLTEKRLPSLVPADAPTSVPRDWRITRLVYQQAFGYAYYSQRQSRDPLEMSLPDAKAFEAAPSGGPKKAGLTLPPPVKK